MFGGLDSTSPVSGASRNSSRIKESRELDFAHH
jgi:hypothetical protein